MGAAGMWNGVKRTRHWWALVTLSAGLVQGAALAAPPTAPPPAATPAALTQTITHPAVVTRHVGTFNGKRVRYTATVKGIDVPQADGRPGARVVSFAYVAEGVKDPASRPVLFLFNGGPISPSIWLHMGAFGPKRISFPDDLNADPSTYKLVDNPYAPLDVADIVFIDPASTGFSRVAPGVSPKSYFSVKADGQQIAEFIAQWLAANGRLSSPKYVLGESYGTLRAPEIAAQLTERKQPILLDGVVLFGQAANIIEYSQRPGNIISYVVSLPTLAATAWYHGKVDRQGKSFAQFLDEARGFSRTEYLTALYQGQALPEAERDRIAQRLEALSGIPASYYRANNLRISKEQYRAELLKDQGLLLGRTDARYKAPMTEKGRVADPSSALINPAYQRFFLQHLRDNLKVDWPEPYLFDSPVGGLDVWDWGAKTPFSDWPYMSRISKLMTANPKARVFVANGYYDTQTTIGAAEYAVNQSGWPPERTALRYYEGGHMAYTVESTAKTFTDDIRDFVMGQLK